MNDSVNESLQPCKERSVKEEESGRERSNHNALCALTYDYRHSRGRYVPSTVQNKLAVGDEAVTSFGKIKGSIRYVIRNYR